MKFLHQRFRTFSTVLILALVVDATPLPALNDVPLVPRNFLVHPGPSFHDHDAVHSIRSYNPFDSSGIFPRVNEAIKNEDSDSVDLGQLPSSDLPATKEKKDDPGVLLSGIASHSETTLHHLGQMADEALRNKQILSFHDSMRQIQSYYRGPNSRGVFVEHTQFPSDVQKLAKEIYGRVDKKWAARDIREIVYIQAMVPRSLLTFCSHSSWDPLRFPEALPEGLRQYLELADDGVSMFHTQRLMDLGHHTLNDATIRRTSLEERTYNDMIISGYQLMLMAAVLALDPLKEKVWFMYILYLIRDAEYAEGNSSAVKACLTSFNRYLTGLQVARRVRGKIELQPESDWKPREGEDGTLGPSLRQIQLNQRVATQGV
ncbi:hypothetical protein H0H93_010871 [Arthromyces matolae]|nr:hypothetical protein H0H93_010871 [Arthromyces matolae]